MSNTTIHTTTRLAASERPITQTYRWPVYLVTAAHSVAQPLGAPHPRVPYGPWHARSIGSLQTVCGLPAVAWHYFWLLEFSKSGEHACPACAAKVTHLVGNH